MPHRDRQRHPRPGGPDDHPAPLTARPHNRSTSVTHSTQERTQNHAAVTTHHPLPVHLGDPAHRNHHRGPHPRPRRAHRPHHGQRVRRRRLDFTPHAALFTALPGILDGDARAGLDPGASASPALLYTCLVLVEVVTVILIVWAVIAGMRQWGPARVRGMASRAEADTLLGVGRLRKVAPVVRPDLHGKGDRR